MKARKISLLLPLALALMSDPPGMAAEEARPWQWAQPLQLIGVPNLYQVTPQLYRGAQPDREGVINLKKLGIRTIINLRENFSDTDLVEDLDLDYYHFPMIPEMPDDQVAYQALNIIADASKQPVFIHCHQGADRTGALVALYRILQQGWSREDAITEMVEGGYHYHKVYYQLISWIALYDPNRVRPAVEIPANNSDFK